MRSLTVCLRGALVASIVSAAALVAPPAHAQDWFVPPAGQGQAGKPPGQQRVQAQQPQPSRGGPRQAQSQDPGVLGGFPPGPGGGPEGDPGSRPQIEVQLPPLPEIPPVPKGSSPPAAVIGVLSVQDVMRQSTAAQQMQKTLGERSKKLNDDAQKEQASWRDMQQQLANQRGTLNAEQIRAKETELQERVTSAQKKFRDRDQIIKEAAQYGLLQIEKVLEQLIQQVSASRNMNLVLHREQVMLNYPEFDLTQQVTEELNKVLPSVQVPPDGMSAVAFAQQLAKDQPTKAAQATPLTATAPAKPAGPAPTKR